MIPGPFVPSPRDHGLDLREAWRGHRRGPHYGARETGAATSDLMCRVAAALDRMTGAGSATRAQRLK